VGHGPLPANELIIIDIFPRVQKTGYYGDMTRTYLKGQASEAQTRLVNTVLEGQQKALNELRGGVSGKAVFETVRAFFDAEGYLTDRRGDLHIGFFHGLGHGLGLGIHEHPSMGIRKSDKLKSGHVVTVEPGLYYPEVGGCRWEDVVRITAEGCEKLSNHPYRWEIR
jgi:Xaa-Pro aminopeptidase